MGLLRWVSNRQRGFLIGGLGLLIGGLGGGVWWPLLAPTSLMVYMCVALLMV